MQILKPILAGAVGTSFMTLYSYAYSHFKNKQFREPELLAHLLEGPEAPFRKDDLVKGWGAHYLVGSVFSFTYQQFFKGNAKNPVLKGAFIGGLYGLAGVVGWRAAFKAHPQPPKINYREYYQHLVLAHLIFGSFAFGILEKEGNKRSKKKSRPKK